MGGGGRDRGGIGVFGGSFDPPHNGHVIAAEEILEALSLDRIVFIPARRSPLKAKGPAASPAARLRMLRSATETNERFEVDGIEVERAGESYAVETLRALSGRRPGERLVLVLGADQWACFGRWRSPREIAVLAEIAVVTRGASSPGSHGAGFEDGPPPRFTEVPITSVELSSTLVRRRTREGRSIRYLVPDGVRRIIEAEGLYLDGRPPGGGCDEDGALRAE